MDEVYDYLIIGGGASGLAASCLLKQKKANTILLEAHSLLGGSSSYFYRSQFCFDVGATTLSGIKNQGPLNKFFTAINLELPLKKIDPGIISCINGKRIHFYSNQPKLLKELIQNFSDISPNILTAYLELNQKNEQLSYQSIQKNNLPIRNILEITKFIKFSNLAYLPLLKLMTQSYYDYLPNEIKQNEIFLKVIDEILFITAQNNSRDTPALFGVLGCEYPNDTYYLDGGMKAFIDALKEKSGPIKVNQKVLAIKKINNLFEVQTSNKTYITKNIISSLPESNNRSLLNLPIENDKETWSAFTLYFTVPNNIKIESLYFQIHTDFIPRIGTKSFFASFSHPNDNKRNKLDQLTVTISTHAMPSVFKSMTPAEYLLAKEEITNFILNKFCDEFKLERNQIQNLESGTPKTFERYTNRFDGSVGGLGHHLNQPIVKKVFHKELAQNFYSIGDTTFPGQGIASVIYGSHSLVDFLYR